MTTTIKHTPHTVTITEATRHGHTAITARRTLPSLAAAMDWRAHVLHRLAEACQGLHVTFHGTLTRAPSATPEPYHTDLPPLRVTPALRPRHSQAFH